MALFTLSKTCLNIEIEIAGAVEIHRHFGAILGSAIRQR